MTNQKLLREISIELSEAKAMLRKKHYRTMKACLLHIEKLIARNVKHIKG